MDITQQWIFIYYSAIYAVHEVSSGANSFTGLKSEKFTERNKLCPPKSNSAPQMW